MIDTNDLEDALLLQINTLRSMEKQDSLVRVSALDEFARVNSRLMADSKQLDAEPLELRCGGSGFEVVQWPQVKSFNYRGPKEAPSSTTPAKYEKTAAESASGIVGFMNEDRDSYIGDSHFNYVGVGVVQEPNELGFMDFWVTLHLADCIDEALVDSSTPTAVVQPDPMVVPSPLREFQNGRWLEQEDPQLASSIKKLDWVQDGIEGMESGVVENLLSIAVLSRPVASAIVSMDWVQDGVDGTEAEAFGWLNNFGSAEVASSVVALGWVEDGIEAIEVTALEQLSYIDYADAEVATSVVTLSWLADGVVEVEVKAIDELGYLAAEDPNVASSIVSFGWMQDGVDDVEAAVLGWLNNFGSAEVVSSVVALGWVDDGIEEIEVTALEQLSYIDYADADVASSVVSMGWVADGVVEGEVRAIEEVTYLAGESPNVASSIVSFGWMHDGVDDVEAEALGWLNNFGSAEIASSVVSLGWMKDGIEEIEAAALEQLSYIDYADAEVASLVVSLGWVADGVVEAEVRAIEELSYLANRDAKVASSVVTLDWVKDGVDGTEAEALGWVNNFGSAEVTSSIVSLGWVEDGIEEIEVKALEQLSYIGNGDVEVASTDVSLDWLRDGTESLDVKLIEELSYLVEKDAEAARRIAGMPFLETIEPADVSAVMSLTRLASFTPDAFVVVMSHAAIRDGISNDQTPVVATLYGVAKNNPGLVDILLDESKVSIEKRTITLTLAGDVDLDIIRTAPGASSSMDLLEHSVRRVEDYMGTPFPRRHVSILYENAVGAGGKNFGTHIAILPEADVDDENELDRTVIAHEVAHYYWGGNKSWIDEGGANFLELQRPSMGTSPKDATASVSDPPCGNVSDIAEFENLENDIDTVCAYSLGERLFVDLYLVLGVERFREGFRTLYLSSESESLGIDQVREAFRSDDGSEVAVISRWYDGTEPYDLSRLDSGPVDPILPSINGRIDQAYVAIGTEGPAVSVFSAQDVSDWVHLTLEYSYDVSSGPRELPLEIVEFYEDGFEFSRNSGDLTAETTYIGGTSWFAVGQSPPRKWAPGRYWVYVYSDDHKIAEVSYEVTP